MYTIRLENTEDHRETETLVREAFWNVYRPGCVEHYLLHCLRSDPAFVTELNYVMEEAGRIIGQAAFVRAEIVCDDGRRLPVLTMGPISILPDRHRMGFGKILLDGSLEKAAELGYGAVFLEGNVLFYGKSGFTAASLFGVRYHGLPEGEDSSFFLCKELIPGYLSGVSGVYMTPSAYFVDEASADDFDKGFPHKEKLVLPGQLF